VQERSGYLWPEQLVNKFFARLNSGSAGIWDTVRSAQLIALGLI